MSWVLPGSGLKELKIQQGDAEAYSYSLCQLQFHCLKFVSGPGVPYKEVKLELPGHIEFPRVVPTLKYAWSASAFTDGCILPQVTRVFLRGGERKAMLPLTQM